MLKRVLIALAASAGVTFGLFFLMQTLVSFDDIRIEESKVFRFIDVVEDIEETPLQEKSREIEKPPEVETPPEIEQIPDESIDGPKISVAIGPASINSGVSLSSIDLGPSSDGDYLPLVRVQPQYPRRAQERGIEGFVVVELTVSEDGTVPPDSIVIVEADPKGYFERAAKKAAEKFKYKPKVVNGQAQAVAGVKYLFRFDLADG